MEVCRICKSEGRGAPLINVFNEYFNVDFNKLREVLTLADMLNECANDRLVNANDGLPQSICALCKQSTLDSFSFKREIQASHKELALSREDLVEDQVEVQSVDLPKLVNTGKPRRMTCHFEVPRKLDRKMPERRKSLTMPRKLDRKPPESKKSLTMPYNLRKDRKTAGYF